jgi:hypothetical protein
MSDTLRIRQTGRLSISAPGLTPSQQTKIGGEAIGRIYDRVTRLHIGLNGSPLAPYSPRGPIYVPATGKGRTKSSLGGRTVLTHGDIRKMRERGVRIAGMRGEYGSARTSTTVDGGKTPSGKSIKFANRSEYKRAMGKSGLRDLEESGQMLGAMTVVVNRPGRIELGFTDEIAEKKAEGNQDLTPWFGLAQSTDVPPVTAMVNQFLAEDFIKKNSRRLQ